MEIKKDLAKGIELQLNNEGGNVSCVVTYNTKKLLDLAASKNDIVLKPLLLNLLTETSGNLLLDGFGVDVSEIKYLKDGIMAAADKMLSSKTKTSIPIEYYYIVNEGSLAIFVGGTEVAKGKVPKNKVETLKLSFLKEQAKYIVDTLKKE